MIRDLRVYLESMGGANRIAYYRDEKGLEVDVILELVDGPDKFLRDAMRPGDRAADGDSPGPVLKAWTTCSGR